MNPEFVNARFLYFRQSLAISVNAEFLNTDFRRARFLNAEWVNAELVTTEFSLAGFCNFGKVSCPCEFRVCECWIFVFLASLAVNVNAEFVNDLIAA